MNRTDPIKFTVKENGKTFPSYYMTEPECYAIQREVEDLLPEPKGDYWFEVDSSLSDYEEDDKPEFMRVWCYKQNPTPKNSSEMESKIPAPLPSELLNALSGKTIRIKPIQYGLSEWADKVEVVFESIPTEPVAKGVKVSYLIAEAKKVQKTKVA